MEKQIIGRKEKADLPTFNLIDKVVKIDSGAYTSSIDVVSIKKDDLVLKVIFEENGKEIHFDSYKIKKIKSSNGVTQERYVMKGLIVLGKETYLTEFSLTDRSGMKFPILLGRKLLNKRFLIDSSKTNLLTK